MLFANALTPIGLSNDNSNSAPVSTGILSLGLQPFVAWHLAVSSSATPVLTDVAYALASKVTSKLISKAR